MFDELDQVPWSTLEHAYGDAGDIPDLIRALVSSDPDEREQAQDMLDMGPFHQESLYSCTPFVVRCLMQLAQEPDMYDKPWLLQYISRVLASALYHLPDPEMLVLAPEELLLEPEEMYAKQIVLEIQPRLRQLLRLIYDSDALVRLAALRLLVMMDADLPDLGRVLSDRLAAETEAQIRSALTFCLGLLADRDMLARIVETLGDVTESLLVRIAAGFSVIAVSNERLPDNVVASFCAVIADNYDALDDFEDVYAEYLTPLGAPRGKDRLLECLPNNLSTHQKNQIILALQHIYAQLPTSASVGIRIGSGYYLNTMVRLAFPQGKLAPETTIHDLTDTQRGILEAFQKYDMPAVSWNVYHSSDYRTVLGFSFRSETDFLDFMSGKRSARETK
ncbi:MAG TPA: hypothetical protein VHI51_07890 [Ktedonobacterales bacterium]|nr:hypothetical protein [Ktedonobacterales bacterium]